MRRALVVLGLALCGFLVLPVAPAAAHPLGNFSVNRYAGLTLHPYRVDAVVVADVAELPTLQDPAPSCAEAAGALTVSVARSRLEWTVDSSSLALTDGAGGLKTSRLECRLTAPAALGAGPAAVTVDNGFRADRIGWRELAATGIGVRLDGSSVPGATISDELRRYPDDLLSSPPDVRSASFTAVPDRAAAAAAAAPARASGAGLAGPLAGAERWLDSVVGGARLTPLVGLLAVLLALVLGAAHAALPGHGKTVMAAYLAGRAGRPRDAVAVGATVTLTHTGGVIALGLLLTTFAGVAGESVLGWLGVASGVLVAAIGLGALLSALRRRRAHHHAHAHGHEHSHGPGRWGIAGLGVAGGLVPSPSALVVLLGAIALGRTAFGILLVFAYGLGMAATLTAAGLLLIRVRDRFAGRLRLLERWRRAWPPATAALIVVVGLGLAGRALSTIA
ncbi:sulfite exporter TauE/SafE family protein [Asanoa sp. WMMD1127]|uniref:nickel/cobalt transporter n=1 Tax=Asanoa sp. WMMD1127 TaxID=3016107 RepID=UPI0024166740|nr:sulfite exporter TauE/SafE family protein [Asanoa sp. WMMD1127]MDG4821389.1 sulfite exporter TauE/SafE family protein [Asanoa sp. WMMD1127]